ncbi:MAG: hypothetical protein WAW23_12800 [Candidatus Methanoperedens sp.]
MATTIEVIGLGFAILGLLAAIYSIVTQRKFETKFKEKERLKILAKRLNEVITKMSRFSKIEDPTYDEHTQLHMISQIIISEAFDKKKDITSISIKTRIAIDELTKNSEGKEEKKTNFIDAEKKEDIINYLEKGKLRCFEITGDFGEEIGGEIMLYSISYFFYYIPDFFYELEKLENEFGDLMEEFSPNLLKSLKDCIKDLLVVAMYSKELKIDTKAFSKTDDIGLRIYNAIMRREEINPYLNKMVELKVKFEKLRESLLTTSYT